MTEGPISSGGLPGPEEDRLVRALQEAMAARADGVATSDQLSLIRQRAHARRRRGRALTALSAAAAVIVLGGAAALTANQWGGGDSVRLTVAATPSSGASTMPTTSVPPPPSAATPPPTTSAPATSVPPPSPTASATPTGLALPSGAKSVPVYWIAGTANPRLFREFVVAPAGVNDPTRALRTMLSGAAIDPDYRTAWASDDDARVELSGGRLVVDVASSAVAGSLSGADAKLAVQQVVYTVTAAAGDDLPVEFLVDGERATSLFGQPLARTVSRAPQSEVQAFAWITGTDTSEAGRVVVEGVGTGYEATLLYTVTDAGGVEVARDAVQAGVNGVFDTYSVTIELPPGEYTVAVFQPDESGGEAPQQEPDTKDITIR